MKQADLFFGMIVGWLLLLLFFPCLFGKIVGKTFNEFQTGFYQEYNAQINLPQVKE